MYQPRDLGGEDALGFGPPLALGIGALALLVTLGATFLYAFPPTPFSPGVGAVVTFLGALCVLGGGVDAVRGSQRPESQPSRTSA